MEKEKFTPKEKKLFRSLWKEIVRMSTISIWIGRMETKIALTALS